MKKGYLTVAMVVFAAITIVAILLIPAQCRADYGSGYSNGTYSTSSMGTSSNVGQYNTGYSAANGGSSSYSARTYYEPYYYYYCGRRYCGYRAVSVPYQTQQATTISNPVGAVNTDNSVAYHYEYNITYSQPPQQQGSTLYGYPSGLTGSTYQNTDLAVLDQYVRLQSDAQGYLNEANSRTSERMRELMAIAQIQSLGNANAAEILAKGAAISEMTKSNAAVAQALKSNDGGALVQSKTTVVQGSGKTTIVPDGTVQPQVQVPQNQPHVTPNTAALAAKTTQLLQQKCVRCHNPEKHTANLDLSNIRNIKPETVQKILARVTETDPLKRMPLGELGPDPTPGQPLTTEELRTLFNAAGAQ